MNQFEKNEYILSIITDCLEIFDDVEYIRDINRDGCSVFDFLITRPCGNAYIEADYSQNMKNNKPDLIKFDFEEKVRCCHNLWPFLFVSDKLNLEEIRSIVKKFIKKLKKEFDPLNYRLNNPETYYRGDGILEQYKSDKQKFKTLVKELCYFRHESNQGLFKLSYG